MMVYLFDTLLVHQELVVMQRVVDAKVFNAGVANSHFLENNRHITITKRAILEGVYKLNNDSRYSQTFFHA